MAFKILAAIFDRALGKLLLGSVSGYGIVLALSPVITRLYSPEDFGLFSIFSSFVAVASVFMSLSLELGILSAKGRREALYFVLLATSIAGFSTAALFVFLTILVAIGIETQLPHWAIALGILSCFVASITSISINWAIYEHKPSVAARSVFASLCGRSFLQAGLGYVYGGLAGLVVGEVLGRLLALLMALEHRIVRPLRHLARTIRHLKIDRSLISPYAVFITPSTAMDTALVWLPAPLFAILFGPYAGGLIAMMQRLGSVPLTIANQSAGQLFHRRTTEKFGIENAYLVRFILKFFIVLLLLTIAASMLILWQGKRLFELVLGDAWGSTYIVALALAPLYLFQFVSLLTNRVILVSGRMSIKLTSSAAQLLMLLITSFLAKYWELSWETALFIVAGCLALTQCIMIMYVLIIVLQTNISKIEKSTDRIQDNINEI